MNQTGSQFNAEWRKVLAACVGVPLAVGLIVLAFLWPVKTSEPNSLPVGIVGPPPAVENFQAAMAENSPSLLDLVEAVDRAEAVSQIERRLTFGAIILAAPPDAPEVLTAPAGSPMASQMLAGLASQLQAKAAEEAAASGAAATPQVQVTPIVPLSESDQAGSGLAAASFPLVIGGAVGGVIIALLVAGAARRATALLGFSLVTGLVMALILGSWFGYLPGGFVASWLAVAMTVLAISAVIAGCAAAAGRAGLGLAVVLTILLANPLSAAQMPWQFLANPWGGIGQLLPPGAGNWLVRSVSYFPAADNTKQWLVLAIWAVLGLALVGLGHLRRDKGKLILPLGAGGH